MAVNPSIVPKAPLRPDPVEIGPICERLVAVHMGFARMQAATVYARRTFKGMEFGDYLQYATVGLIEAIDRFDPSAATCSKRSPRSA